MAQTKIDEVPITKSEFKEAYSFMIKKFQEYEVRVNRLQAEVNQLKENKQEKDTTRFLE